MALVFVKFLAKEIWTSEGKCQFFKTGETHGPRAGVSNDEKSVAPSGTLAKTRHYPTGIPNSACLGSRKQPSVETDEKVLFPHCLERRTALKEVQQRYAPQSFQKPESQQDSQRSPCTDGTTRVRNSLDGTTSDGNIEPAIFGPNGSGSKGGQKSHEEYISDAAVYDFRGGYSHGSRKQRPPGGDENPNDRNNPGEGGRGSGNGGNQGSGGPPDDEPVTSVVPSQSKRRYYKREFYQDLWTCVRFGPLHPLFTAYHL